jgi:hypothetical protein
MLCACVYSHYWENFMRESMPICLARRCLRTDKTDPTSVGLGRSQSTKFIFPSLSLISSFVLAWRHDAAAQNVHFNEMSDFTKLQPSTVTREREREREKKNVLLFLRSAEFDQAKWTSGRRQWYLRPRLAERSEAARACVCFSIMLQDFFFVSSIELHPPPLCHLLHFWLCLFVSLSLCPFVRSSSPFSVLCFDLWVDGQGGQIGRILAHWAFVYSRQFCFKFFKLFISSGLLFNTVKFMY